MSGEFWLSCRNERDACFICGMGAGVLESFEGLLGCFEGALEGFEGLLEGFEGLLAGCR